MNYEELRRKAQELEEDSHKRELLAKRLRNAVLDRDQLDSAKSSNRVDGDSYIGISKGVFVGNVSKGVKDYITNQIESEIEVLIQNAIEKGKQMAEHRISGIQEQINEL